MTDILIKIQELEILTRELIYLKEELASLNSSFIDEDEYAYKKLQHESYKADEKIDNLFADIKKMIEGITKND